jgi:integrase
MKIKTILYKHRVHKDGKMSVKIYVNANGKVRYYPTGFAVHPDQWNEEREKVKPGNFYTTAYNEQIAKKRHQIEHHFITGGTHEELATGKKTRTGSLIDFLGDFIRRINEGKTMIRKSTGKNYASLLSRLLGYAKHKAYKDIYFSDVSLAFYTDFLEYLFDYAQCSKAGAGKHIKNLKAIMNKALSKGLHNNRTHQQKEFKVFRMSPRKIYLNIDEIKSMERLSLKDAPMLERERDRFLICYYLLLRFSDCRHIRKDNCFISDGHTYIKTHHQKTQKEAILPLSKKAILLLEKYDFQLNFTANQVANRHLKTIAGMAGINSPYKEMDKTLPKSQFVTTHTARRSAATNLYLQGVSLKTISDLGGWSSIRTLMVYLQSCGMDSARLASGLDFFT